MIVSASKARAELGWKPRYPTSADVAIAFGKHVRTAPDRRIRLFLAMVPRLARRAREKGEMPREAEGMKLAIHIDVTGPHGADFGFYLDHGVVTLKPGIPRPPDSTVTLTAETFLELLAGGADTATASMSGKIRVRGEPIASLVLAGVINGFRRATAQEGMQGRVARGLSRWFEKGAPKA